MYIQSSLNHLIDEQVMQRSFQLCFVQSGYPAARWVVRHRFGGQRFGEMEVWALGKLTVQGVYACRKMLTSQV